MNRISGIMSSLHVPVKAVVITIMAMIFSHFVIYDLMSVSFFSPMEKSSDFRFRDFYTIVANDRAVAQLDTNIIIVPVDGCKRPEIALALDNIDFCEPAAVGLDIAFTPPSDPDNDPLAKSLALCSNLIMPIAINDSEEGFKMEHVSYYDNIVTPSGGYAAINIQGEINRRETVRNFSHSFLTGEGEVLSMPAALVSVAFPAAARSLNERKKNEEMISYASRRFEVIHPDDILSNADLIKGKIVFIGKLKDAGDLHVTPIDNFTPGLMIHAFTASTILSGDYTETLSDFEMYLLTGILCFIVVLLNLSLMTSSFGQLLIRLFQVLLLYLMIVIGSWMYIRCNVDLDFAFTMLVISLGVAACDIYAGIFDKGGLIDKLYGFPEIVKKLIYKIKISKKNEKENRAHADASVDIDVVGALESRSDIEDISTEWRSSDKEESEISESTTKSSS